uniref:V-type proton ATPase subunit C n=1 Tax=Odontella aurita TaxID=265563 RepID=A0A7S4HPY9_9STRA|mmetsp:Transcript_134/g.268  ORF Transcript_134/g.268 Transcript_134/m.268 type:complete len:421 (+) Transcript_134:109-1371(+)
MSYFIAAISNGGGAPEQAYRKLQSAGACPEAPFAEMFKFEVPSLMVGTLDSLMTLSDDLIKVDAIVEGIVRKIEKTGVELSGGKKDLTVGGVPANRYIQQFAWDYAKYPNRRQLKELVALISGGVSAVDEELKQLGTSFADKQAALTEAKRKKAGNLLVADLNDTLTQDDMRKVTIHDTDYLKTVMIAIPKSLKENFEANIESLGNSLVGYGGPDWSRDPHNLGKEVKFGALVDRHSKRGSPVVPGSTQLVKEDENSSLYAVTILKSQYEAGYYEGDEFQPGTKVNFEQEFDKACKEKRYILRPFSYDPSQANKATMALEQLKVEVDGMKSGLTRWCKTHYGEAFVAWMHIKVIRVFVESVLRYGLPVDFTAVLYKIAPGKDAELTEALDRALGGDKDSDDKGLDDDEEYHEFVLLKFDP